MSIASPLLQIALPNSNFNVAHVLKSVSADPGLEPSDTFYNCQRKLREKLVCRFQAHGRLEVPFKFPKVIEDMKVIDRLALVLASPSREVVPCGSSQS